MSLTPTKGKTMDVRVATLTQAAVDYIAPRFSTTCSEWENVEVPGVGFFSVMVAKRKGKRLALITTGYKEPDGVHTANWEWTPDGTLWLDNSHIVKAIPLN
jgi:hypothetical protein